MFTAAAASYSNGRIANDKRLKDKAEKDQRVTTLSYKQHMNENPTQLLTSAASIPLPLTITCLL